MELDAAFENPKIVDWKRVDGTENYEIEIIHGVDSKREEELMQKRSALKDAWENWLALNKNRTS